MLVDCWVERMAEMMADKTVELLVGTTVAKMAAM